MARGGYRKPTNPASVSGPGALSRRTDGNPTQAAKYMAGGKYGEGQAMLDLQRQAPMAAATNVSTPTAVSNIPVMKPVPTLFDKTNNPDIPVTHGAPYGPGAGVEALGFASAPSLYTTISTLANFDVSGEAEALANIVLNQGL